LREASSSWYGQAMVVLGIDPGTLHLGWGLVRNEGNRLHHVSHGVIDLPPDWHLPRRLRRIDEELGAMMQRFLPEVGVVETMFFAKDAQASMKLSHARGVVLLGLARADIEVAEYAPTRVKRTVTGRGQATKEQVAQMVRVILALEEVPRSDAADALALAVTHLRLGPTERRLRELESNPAASGVAELLLRARAGRRRTRRSLTPGA
jgi:crossover junction endodeoxyribonuclease RuvC